MKRGRPLARKTPLRRRTRLRARSATNAYRRRPRDIGYMKLVKKLPCIIRYGWIEAIINGRALGRELTHRGWYRLSDHTLLTGNERPTAVNVLDYFDDLMGIPTPTSCEGNVQADHAGERGLGQKAPDDTCIPLCRKHHEERTDYKQTFHWWTKVEMRAWNDWAISYTRAHVDELRKATIGIYAEVSDG